VGLYYYSSLQDITYTFILWIGLSASAELDDNTPSKSDYKDPKTIAFLVKDGRYQIYMPEGKYAELEEG
jgi:hypothetical protein